MNDTSFCPTKFSISSKVHLFLSLQIHHIKIANFAVMMSIIIYFFKGEGHLFPSPNLFNIINIYIIFTISNEKNLLNKTDFPSPYLIKTSKQGERKTIPLPLLSSPLLPSTLLSIQTTKHTVKEGNAGYSHLVKKQWPVNINDT